MKAKQLLLGVVVAAGFGLAAIGANAAPSAKFIGTWNLDLSGMPANPPPPKSITLVTSDAGGGKWKSTIETVGADGKSSKSAVTYAVDGKDYPVTGDPTYNSSAFTSPDPNTLVIVEKQNGKLFDTVTTKLSADGNTQNATTVTADGKSSPGVWKRK